MKIGILYIATGRYSVFWEDFFHSAERYFLPEDEKHYFIFSDYKLPFIGEETGRIHRIYQEKLGWPYDTLMRFDMFIKAEAQLKEMDYLFFFNANMEIIQEISKEEILGKNKPLIATKHPGFFNVVDNKLFTYDRNPNSLAYIPYGEGEYYFMGGLNGGKTSHYLLMAKILSHRIHLDLKKGIIALWHDESHLNHYFCYNAEKFHLLSEKYGKPEEEINSIFLLKYYYRIKNQESRIKNQESSYKIIIRDKKNPRFGGHNWLRGETDKKIHQNVLKRLCFHFRIIFNLIKTIKYVKNKKRP